MKYTALMSYSHCVLLEQAFVVVGDHNGHVGLGVKCAKEVSILVTLPNLQT